MKKTSIALIAAAMLLLAGCAQSGGSGSADQAGQPETDAKATETAESASPSPDAKEQIELTIFKYGGVTLTQTEVEAYFAPVEAKFPHIQIKLLDIPEGDPIEPLLTAGTIPDLIFGGSYGELKEKDLLADLAPLKEKYGYDESRLKPEVVSAINQSSEGNQFPFSVNLPVLYVNKDIFDRFGVPYINEVKTWDEIIDIAKQLTRTEDGVNYIGIDLSPTKLGSSLSLDIIDPATGQAAITNAEWTKVFQTIKKLYDIPGFVQGDDYRHDDKDDVFYVDQNLAMYTHNLAQLVGPLEELRRQGVTLNWDFAPHPNFEEALGTSLEINVHRFGITKGGAHQEEAYQVLNYLLSDEVQRLVSRNGRVSVLNNPELEKEFGADVEVLKGKTIENIFKATPRNLNAENPYERKITSYIGEAAEAVAIGGADVNTALREAAEKIDKDLETLKNTK
ncbi:extracellular solute-binding protein [Paenibacillus soyae]|uniref:Extracellular solute-binding protein n=1 Tax=Paenibacillus soyae TaxID=2969249 RepID=A0A9X2S8R4_9BACL|nr:extracellular solute-binding protein [Paenibacillus soyae]MCR2804679.1 extracellular solute-binding protein [Paenibacillus soyae]